MIGRFISILLLVCHSQTTFSAEPQLYPTGPSEDSSYIRFINTLGDKLDIRAGSNVRIELGQTDTSTPWQAVKANTQLGASLTFRNKSLEVGVRVKPSEFLTVAAIQDPKDGWKVVEVRESSPDFSSLKVAFGLVNLVPSCSSATVKLSSKNVVIVDSVPFLSIVRRMVNPVTLSVDLYCGDMRVVEGANLNLRSGERWTLIAYPDGQGIGMKSVIDKLP